MDWIALVTSGFAEAIWAAALAASRGFKRPGPTLVFVVGLGASLAGLAYAMRTIPTGTAYAVWVGIGASTTMTWSLLTRAERATSVRLACVLALVACVVGLKVVS